MRYIVMSLINLLNIVLASDWIFLYCGESFVDYVTLDISCSEINYLHSSFELFSFLRNATLTKFEHDSAIF